MNFIDSSIAKLKLQVWARWKVNFYPSFNLSHSQFGEDMIVRFLTNDSHEGFYVDIGAHHPIFCSNTYHFYCKGWRGINIDAMPSSMDIFKVLRPKDINLEACLSHAEGLDVDFFMFNSPGLNTCDREIAEQVLAKGTAKLVEKRRLKTTTLSNCLNKYLPPNVGIDLMSIDIEGLDETILMSNNWELYKPKVLIFEKQQASIQELSQLSIIKHLNSFGYDLVTKCGPSIILKLDRAI